MVNFDYPAVVENSFYFVYSENFMCRPHSVMARGFIAVLAFGPSYSMPPQVAGSQFLVNRPVVTANVFPAAIACGGTLMHIHGKNIVKTDFGTPHCIFGSQALRAQVISSTIALRVPVETHSDSSASIELSSYH